MYNSEWICLQSYSGLVFCFLLGYPYIYYVVQKGLHYFMPRLLLDLACS